MIITPAFFALLTKNGQTSFRSSTSVLQSFCHQPTSQGLNKDASQQHRRNFLDNLFVTSTHTAAAAGLLCAGLTSQIVSAATVENGATIGTVNVTLQSPKDRLGVELFELEIGSPPRQVVAIRNGSPNQPRLEAGLVLNDYTSAEALKSRIQGGPYPINLVFRNLAAGGDAFADTGRPLVGAQDALNLAQSSATDSIEKDAGIVSKQNIASGYRIDVVTKPSSCKIQSRRNDVLEISYVAKFEGTPPIVYDSSERRGTGQPYQMVLGSGDMLIGVDLGLYEMCPGERRILTIPSRLAYGSKGNRLFGVPPNQALTWEVELVRINGVVGAGDERTREEMEERVPYTSTP